MTLSFSCFRSQRRFAPHPPHPTAAVGIFRKIVKWSKIGIEKLQDYGKEKKEGDVGFVDKAKGKAAEKLAAKVDKAVDDATSKVDEKLENQEELLDEALGEEAKEEAVAGTETKVRGPEYSLFRLPF